MNGIKDTFSGMDEWDQRIAQSFEPAKPLTGDFDRRVMTAIRSSARARSSRRTVLMTMSVYWLVACLAGIWLFSGAMATENPLLNPVALGFTLGPLVISVWLMMRQAGFRLSGLFLLTIR